MFDLKSTYDLFSFNHNLTVMTPEESNVQHLIVGNLTMEVKVVMHLSHDLWLKQLNESKLLCKGINQF